MCCVKVHVRVGHSLAHGCVCVAVCELSLQHNDPPNTHDPHDTHTHTHTHTHASLKEQLSSAMWSKPIKLSGRTALKRSAVRNLCAKLRTQFEAAHPTGEFNQHALLSTADDLSAAASSSGKNASLTLLRVATVPPRYSATAGGPTHSAGSTGKSGQGRGRGRGRGRVGRAAAVGARQESAPAVPSTIVSVYVRSGDECPLMVDVSTRQDWFYPSVYALWRLPTLLPVIYIHPPVLHHILKGAGRSR
jgi:hypothetical protein